MNELEEMQKNPETYLKEIDQEEGSFEFLKTFDIDKKTEEISNLLKQNEFIKENHEKLIGENLNYNQFWERYFFNYQNYIKDEKKKKEKLNEEPLEEWEQEEEEEEMNQIQPILKENKILKEKMKEMENKMKEKEEKINKMEQELNTILQSGDDSIKNLLELKENELKGFRNKFEKIESLWKKNQMKELELFFNDLFKQDLSKPEMNQETKEEDAFDWE
jgi:hypothetical protein